MGVCFSDIKSDDPSQNTVTEVIEKNITVLFEDEFSTKRPDTPRPED